MLPVPPPIIHQTVREYLGAGIPGASNGHVAVATDGSEYHAKGIQFDPGNLLGPANELIVAQLLDYLRVPVPPFVILVEGTKLLFGSLYIKRVAGRFTPEIFKFASNQEDAYRIMACDVWLCNPDRHDRNILAERIGNLTDESDPEYKIWAIDHERAILGPGQGIPDLPTQHLIPFERLVRSLLPCISNPNSVDAAIRAIELVPDIVVENAVDNLPNSMLNPAEKSAYKGFIGERRSKVREVIDTNRHLFPNLK